MAEDEDRAKVDAEGQDEGPQPAESEPDTQKPEPKPGVTAPLDDLTEEEADMEPTGILPGAGPDEADELAEKKREAEREGRPWGWEDEE